MITIAAMISTTKAIRTARKVKGSIYGRPKRAPMNPVLHKSTNRAGAVAIASRVRRMRSRHGWAWINRAARAAIPFFLQGVADPLSALPPKADMCSAQADVRFVPIADIADRRA